MKAQMSLEYVFAAFVWVIICSAAAYSLSPHIYALAYQDSLRAQSAAVGNLAGAAASDVDGMRYLYGNYRIGGNFTFNNTSASIQVDEEEMIAGSTANYTYSDKIQLGDKLLIKNQDGKALAVKVA